jgi:hypothetical protein
MCRPQGPVPAGEGNDVPRHRLLNKDELRQLFGIPADREVNRAGIVGGKSS